MMVNKIYPAPLDGEEDEVLNYDAHEFGDDDYNEEQESEDEEMLSGTEEEGEDEELDILEE